MRLCKAASILITLWILGSALGANAKGTDQSLEQFLKTSATRVEEAFFDDNLKYFVNQDSKNREITWFEGSITTTKGHVFDQLMLIFHVFNNSVYLKSDNTYFKLSTADVSSFVLKDQQRERHFQRNFGVSRSYEIQASYNIDLTLIFSWITEYTSNNTLEIEDFRSTAVQNSYDRMQISIKTTGKESLFDFVQYLSQRPGMHDVRILTELPELAENQFFELLVDDHIKLLKLHKRNISGSQSVSLVKSTEIYVFDEENYFLGNQKGQIHRILLNKYSVRKGLEETGFVIPGRIPPIRNEQRLIRWLQRVKNDLVFGN